MRNIKRLLILLAIFTIGGVGITYAAGNASNQVSNFFMGGADLGSANVNQVLALLVGPQGPPGPAGVAGKDGFVGMNGLNGKDGIDGAPGAVGPQGPAGPVGATGATGPQGPAGPAGPAGPQGPAGANGTNGTNGINGTGGTTGNGNLGEGQLSINSCVSQVGLSFDQSFTGSDFRLSAVTVTGIDPSCAGEKLSVFFPIKSTGAKFGSSTRYALGDNIKCSINVTNAMLPNTGANNTIVVADTAQANNVPAATCVNTSTSNSAILLSDISTQDLGGSIGFTLGN